MARVTVEDCVQKVVNRFELVVLAAERAKKINSGSPILVKRDNDKDPIVALREIAEGYSIDELRNALVTRLQKYNKIDEIENDDEISPEEEIGDDFEYIADGDSFLENDEIFEDISEEDSLKK